MLVPYNRRRSHSDSDDYGYLNEINPVDVFTFKDKTVKTKSNKQAYEQAAAVIRFRDAQRNPFRPASVSQQVFGRYTYDSNDDRLTLTLEQMSKRVETIVDMYYSCSL